MLYNYALYSSKVGDIYSFYIILYPTCNTYFFKKVILHVQAIDGDLGIPRRVVYGNLSGKQIKTVLQSTK